MKKEIKALVDKIEAEKLITISDDGVGTLAEGAVEKLLPEGMTKQQLDDAVKAQSNIGGALAIAFGTQSKAVFDKNKELEEAKFTTKISDSTELSVATRRQVTFQSTFGDSTVNGYTKIKYETQHPMSEKSIRKHITKVWDGVSD